MKTARSGANPRPARRYWIWAASPQSKRKRSPWRWTATQARVRSSVGVPLVVPRNVILKAGAVMAAADYPQGKRRLGMISRPAATSLVGAQFDVEEHSRHRRRRFHWLAPGREPVGERAASGR